MPRADFRFRWPMRVRYAECDPQRVVFNSRYLEYIDVGVTEYWRALGLWDVGGEPFETHVARTVIEYKAPLRNDEAFEVCLRVARIGRTSLTQLWEIHGGEGDDLRACGETVAVHVNLDTNRPLPIADEIVRRFEAFEGRPLKLEKAA